MLIENWKGEREKRVCRSDILFARKQTVLDDLH